MILKSLVPCGLTSPYAFREQLLGGEIYKRKKVAGIASLSDSHSRAVLIHLFTPPFFQIPSVVTSAGLRGILTLWYVLTLFLEVSEFLASIFFPG